MAAWMSCASCCGKNLRRPLFPAGSLRTLTVSAWEWESPPSRCVTSCSSSAVDWTATRTLFTLTCKLRQLRELGESVFVNAPLPCSTASDKQRDKTVNHRKLAVIDDREKAMRKMDHKVSHSHFTADDKRSQMREKAD